MTRLNNRLSERDARKYVTEEGSTCPCCGARIVLVMSLWNDGSDFDALHAIQRAMKNGMAWLISAEKAEEDLVTGHGRLGEDTR